MAVRLNVKGDRQRARRHRRGCGTLAGLALLSTVISGCDRAPPGNSNDFAMLAQADAAYRQAMPGTALRFPEDHGAHPDYRIEWWYLTANLEDEAGRPWGVQWTLFRTAMRPGSKHEGEGDAEGSANPWHSDQVWMAHFAVSAPDGHRAFQRYARGGDHAGTRQAGAMAWPFAAWLDDWRLESTGDDWLPLAMSAAQGGIEANLVLDSDQSLVLQGQDGFSQKHPDGGGSFYYSHPWLNARGTLTAGGETVRVTGQAWLDREWSSQFLQKDQRGWDWFALHLEGGDKLMAFQLRSASGAAYRHGVLLRRDGSRHIAGPGDISLDPRRHADVAERRIPVAWRLSWPEAELELDIEAGRDAQWMDVDFPYWEGRVTVRGDDGTPQGVGYLEMTGYARRNP